MSIAPPPDDPQDLGDLAMAWLEADPRSLAMLDGQLGILWANAPATALIASRNGVESRNGALAMRDRSLQGALRSFVRTSGDLASVWSVPRVDGNGFLLLRSKRLGDGETFSLSLMRTGPEYRFTYRELDRAFGLTPAEHRVLLGLLAGNDAELLAERHGVSVVTTRSHIRGIYSKLGVKSRERLFALVQPFRV